VRGRRIRLTFCLKSLVALILGLTFGSVAGVVSAQTETLAAATPPTAAVEPDVMLKRIARARALAAAHKLSAAIFELEAVRSATTDSSISDVARIMLMNIYLEEADYKRADALLVETFKARSRQNESSIQSYFALAGQTLNGARSHLERYRAFGINIADRSLPPEALYDLDHLRQLLERIAEQAKDICDEDAKRTDAVALMEDVSSLRATLARDDEDRTRWQQECANARQKLAASETRLASTGGIPVHAPASFTSGQTGTAKSNSSEPATSSRNSAPATETFDAPVKQAAAIEANSVAASPKPVSQSQAAVKTAGANAQFEGQAVKVGALIDMAVKRVNPSYPSVAKNARVAGLVTVFVVVDENGAVVEVERVNGPQLLQQAATEAAKKWRFHPTLVNGQPVRVSGFINFNFTL
jgi:TonB family protein